MTKQYLIFLQFLKRDFYTFRHRITKYLINYALLYPAMYSFMFCYLMPNIMYGPGHESQGTILFIGHVLISIFVLGFSLAISLLFDLENQRFINYQITLLNPRLVLLERVVFASLFAFIICIPFYPMAKLFMGDAFVTTNTSWLSMYLMLYLSGLCCAAYGNLVSCYIKSSRQLRPFWVRVNFPLMTFGGVFIPWFVVKQFSPLFAYVLLLNPLLYISEGLRSTITGQPEFFNPLLCACMLLIYTTLFMLASWHYFKKRTDHI